MDAPNPSATPTFASRTPLHIGAVGLIARDLDLLAGYYQNLLGLTVLERTPKLARLGVGGVDAARDRAPARRQARRRAHRRPLPHRLPDADAAGPRALDHAHREEPRADHRRVRPRRQRSVLSRRSGRQRRRGLQRPAARALAARGRHDRDADQAARHRGDPARGRSADRRLSRPRRRDCASAISICASATSSRPSSSIAARSAST